MFLFSFVKPVEIYLITYLILCSFGFSMFSTLSRVEKAVGFGFTDGVQEPRCKVSKLFILFSFNYKLVKFASDSQM